MMKQLKVLAASALVAELDGSVLAEKNAHQRVPIASVTKLIIIYQLYAAVERHQLNWTDQLTTTKRIAEFTKGEVVAEIKLTEGETYTVKDALDALLILSENTFAFVFAEKLFKNLTNWHRKTIALLESWGINNPIIPNPAGLSNQDLETYKDPEMTDSYEPLFSAKEVLIITEKIVDRFPEVLKIAQEWKFNFKSNRQEYPYLNRFKFLAITKHKWIGLKTGTSPDTESFVGIVQSDQKQFVTVYLAAKIDFLEPKGRNCYVESEKMLSSVLK
ncbi:D-alanyl-D-alanine carboxypeptidase family protein [Oenococcus oeni]|nr:serine hydrolase [Oenococcus oeni]EFD87763.1 hypothetical protein AWRIB429_1589 [Oenococcus oeni AWRIB429]EJO00390.1 D-alanyl-D-alanine carboxypeptidase [Oenococcus oeni AWRIB419]EJO00857.1 D-alanyl-D-alanine carboxypeptidase [Oenococcus oeni AWRIB318]EJO08456.1 D-alanyl-D-alanine carboxypeptidase [Oenococcus oeni AWRIB553]EJO10825.1 D-alanyl-D-alanine carboxypeptidase [Oenococcus oeni AWRIB568]